MFTNRNTGYEVKKYEGNLDFVFSKVGNSLVCDGYKIHIYSHFPYNYIRVFSRDGEIIDDGFKTVEDAKEFIKHCIACEKKVEEYLANKR